MAMKTVKWLGGPLDGAAEHVDSGAVLQSISVWPDPAMPKNMVIVYLLMSDGHYHFNQQATDRANQARNRPA